MPPPPQLKTKITRDFGFYWLFQENKVKIPEIERKTNPNYKQKENFSCDFVFVCGFSKQKKKKKKINPKSHVKLLFIFNWESGKVF